MTVRRTHQPFEELFRVLGIDLAGRDPKEVPTEEINKARRQRVIENHESKFINAPEAEKAAAAVRIRDVNAAYDLVKDHASINRHQNNIDRETGQMRAAAERAAAAEAARRAGGGAGAENAADAARREEAARRAGAQSAAQRRAEAMRRAAEAARRAEAEAGENLRREAAQRAAREAEEAARRAAGARSAPPGGGPGNPFTGRAGSPPPRRPFSSGNARAAARNERSFIDWALRTSEGEIHAGKAVLVGVGLLAVGATIYQFVKDKKSMQDLGWSDRETARYMNPQPQPFI